MSVIIKDAGQRYGHDFAYYKPSWSVYWSIDFDEPEGAEENVEEFLCKRCAEIHAKQHKDRNFHDTLLYNQKLTKSYFTLCRMIKIDVHYDH